MRFRRDMENRRFKGLRKCIEAVPRACVVSVTLLAIPMSRAQTVALDSPADIQAVVRTSSGSLVLEFYPDEAPDLVDRFIRQAAEGFYDGTIFHSMVPDGIVQGGDPLTRDPERRAEYGSGGFEGAVASESNNLPFAAGTLGATRLPGAPGEGSQFFLVVNEQPQFAGQFSAFGHVVEGLDVLREISLTSTDERQIALDRVEILDITFRRPPPPALAPYATETIEELRMLTVVMETSVGEIGIGLFPDLAPNHVRHFLRLVSLGVYDHTAIHRVVPGFVIQAGDLNTRTEPYPEAAREYVVEIDAEFGDRPHTRGIVSLARRDDPSSGMTSFFIVLADQPALDGVYTVFGKILSGMDVVDRIAAVEADSERPLERVDVYAMRVARRN